VTDFIYRVPAWVFAAMRYAIALIGVILVATDVLPEQAWDQLVATATTLITVAYGIWRTREIEQELNEAVDVLDVLSMSGAFAGMLGNEPTVN
jgi:hypothetical protein